LTTEPQTACKQLFLQAAQEMITKLQTAGQPMGRTTAAVVWLTDSMTLAAHVGDSRIYYFGKDYIWRSHDHSYAQLLVDEGQLTEQEMAHHPSQTQLLRSIGADEDPSPDIKELPPLKPNERLVLCTDGFWEYTGTETMETLCRSEDLRHALDKQTAVIKDRAGPVCDNITAIIIRY
jgi:serine/threonine protein phosphatase PrpC